ncbi:MAG: ribonuclease R [Gammaproteobacteria bacterium]|nr:ribonuclease R [Gammaproteobacteria bacterium]
MARRKKIQDPFALREAEKYANPIPSRECIIELLRNTKKSLTYEKIAEMLAVNIEEEEQGEALRRRLRAMERDGQLIFNRRGGYIPIEEADLIRGRVVGHKDGFGFVIPEDGGDDLFLSPRQMRRVFDGDRVLVNVSGVDRRGRREGTIVEVLERHTQQLVGRLTLEQGVAIVSPDNKRIQQDILIPPAELNGAEQGQIVMIEILTQPSLRGQAMGRVIEILGDHMAPGMEIDVAIRSYQLPHKWPAEVDEEMRDLRPHVLEEDKKNRVDLRHLPLLTIDGEDAKDFDDAVYCEEKKGGGWRLYVAIADVSHYVRPGTALDEEASKRGNSVYFPGFVIPMLPEALSNNLCSLVPHADRLCFVAEMEISKAGKLVRSQFYRAVMHSQARLTYTTVAALLSNVDPQLQVDHHDVLQPLQRLHTLYQTLKQAREARGALDFDTVETKVVFGENRKIEQIVPVVRNDAHKLIEECMILANVAAAKFIIKNRKTGMFRVHGGPNPEKLVDLRHFLAEFSLGLRGGKTPSPHHYAEVIERLHGRPDFYLIQTVLLRSLSQAFYGIENTGHFGLALEAYTHFTSPIRRYPDLLVHRLIHQILSGQVTDEVSDAHLARYAEQSSMTERRADEATRSALDRLKCEFMLEHVGAEFDGFITSVTGFGLFVSLKDIYIEGLVHVTALKNDYYRFDPVKHSLQGERTGKGYRLGDRIRVKVMRVDLDDKFIDFALAETKTQEKPSKRKKRK